MGTIGDRFRYLRGELTQQQFAEFVGSTKQNISKYEKNLMMPGGDLLLRLIQRLSVNINWLLCGVGEPYSITKKKSKLLV